MQSADPNTALARGALLPYFIDSFGRPLRTPYYVSQLQTLLEDRFFPWVTFSALKSLESEGILTRVEVPTKNASKVVFYFNSALNTPLRPP